MLLMVLAVVVMASINAMIVPLALEKQILLHPRSPPLASLARECEEEQTCWSGRIHGTDFQGLTLAQHCASNTSNLR